MDPEMVLSVVDITDEIQVHISEAIDGRKCEPWSILIDTIIITVRNSSCGKAMLSQVSVILSGGCAWWGMCMAGGVHGRRHAWWGG